jgi:hypothetical protein
MDGWVVWLFRFQAQAVVPVPGGPSAGSRQTVREVKFVKCSSCSLLVLERSLFNPFGQLFLTGRGLADRLSRGRKPSARHKLLSDSPRVGYGPSAFWGALLVVLLRLTDCPPCPRGPSTPASRTVRQGFRTIAKSFAS